MSIKKISLIALPLAVVLGTTACGAQGTTVEPNKDVAQSSNEAQEEDLEESYEDEGPKENDATFGDTVTWDDGLSLTVTHKDSVSLSEVGAADTCETGDAVEVFTIKIENGTESIFSPMEVYGFEAIVTRGEEDVNAPEVFDSAGYGHDYELTSLMDMPDLRPSRSSTITSGYCTVDDGLVDDLILIGDFDDYESEIPRGLVYFSNSGVGGF